MRCIAGWKLLNCRTINDTSSSARKVEKEIPRTTRKDMPPSSAMENEEYDAKEMDAAMHYIDFQKSNWYRTQVE